MREFSVFFECPSCGSETWCVKENKVAILKRPKRCMVRAMCFVKLVNKKNTEELMNMLGLKEAPDKLARVNGANGVNRADPR